jgi:uncharacterized membrane protein YcaP (DUF421 family)
MTAIFFDNWQSLLRTLVIGVLAYVILILFLRISGKRTLAKLNAFDLVVTVALGSTLATVLLTKNVALLDGTLGLGLLITMQFVITWSSVRWDWLRRAVREQPTLLVRNGQLRHAELVDQRLTEGEILAAIRSAGIARIADVAAVVLETDGSLSVLRDSGQGPPTALADVPGAELRET